MRPLKQGLSDMESSDPELQVLAAEYIHDTLNFMKRIADGELRLVKLIPLAVVLSIFVSFRRSRPIIELARTMQETDLSSFILSPAQGRDEIGLLEEGYKSMMRRIRELIQEEYQREIELRDARILALQPLVENAFEHVLQGKEGSWELKIRVIRLGRSVRLMVYDNGCGFTGEQIKEIRRRLWRRILPEQEAGHSRNTRGSQGNRAYQCKHADKASVRLPLGAASVQPGRHGNPPGGNTPLPGER
jgi:HAMP domain-containing protein